MSLLLQCGARGDLYLLETFIDPFKEKGTQKITPMLAALEISFWNRDLCCVIIRNLVRHGAASTFSDSVFWTFPNGNHFIFPPPRPSLHAANSIPKKPVSISQEVEKIVALFQDVLSDLFSRCLDQTSVNKMIKFITMHGKTPQDQQLVAEYANRKLNNIA